MPAANSTRRAMSSQKNQAGIMPSTRYRIDTAMIMR